MPEERFSNKLKKINPNYHSRGLFGMAKQIILQEPPQI